MIFSISVDLDVHSEITRDENYNYHYADDVENVHLFSPRRLCELACPIAVLPSANNLILSRSIAGALAAIPSATGISVARITVILSRSIAGALTPIPSATGISLAPIGFMMTDGTACACAEKAVPDEMPGNAADHRSFYAAGRLRRA
jgi:hypothetical protein